MRALIVALALALALVLVPAAAAKPLLGVTGNVPRFDKQTGQTTFVHQAFLRADHARGDRLR